MVRSAGRFSFAAASPDDKSKGAGKMLCLMPLSDGLLEEFLFGLCCDHREGDG